jgi:hypothetical protein
VVVSFIGEGNRSTQRKPLHFHCCIWDRCGRDRMVVRFTLPVQSVPITTNVVSWKPVHGEVYSVQQYVISLSVTCDHDHGGPKYRNENVVLICHLFHVRLRTYTFLSNIFSDNIHDIYNILSTPNRDVDI